MRKILTVIGARPQIIKAAAISRAVREVFADRVEEIILHTGQHYDSNMSEVFFDELGIPKPTYNLGVGSGRHGAQTAKMIAGIEDLLLKEHFDGILLYGDTNSTLAGAVAASKLHVPIFHVEAGLRSHNMAMPEEVNRIVCDQLASILFTPTETGLRNLQEEGFFASMAQFKNGKKRIVTNCGDVMYDNSLFYTEQAGQKCNIINQYGLGNKKYILVTIHRDNNTDNPTRLSNIFKALLDIASQNDIEVIIPLHPRTQKLLPVNLSQTLYTTLVTSKKIKLTPPASFFEMIELERHATTVMTDSGGVQKEAFFFERPCVILRPETEWVEIVEHGAGLLADANYDKIMAAYKKMTETKVTFPKIFGDGKAAVRILDTIVDYLRL